MLDIYQRIIQQSGGAFGVRDLGALELAVAQPRATFGNQDLYPAIVDKASALGFSINQNHPFMDGNKRLGHAAMEVFPILNGFEVRADVDERERVILDIASGAFSRDSFRDWLASHIKPITSEDK